MTDACIWYVSSVPFSSFYFHCYFFLYLFLYSTCFLPSCLSSFLLFVLILILIILFRYVKFATMSSAGFVKAPGQSMETRLADTTLVTGK